MALLATAALAVCLYVPPLDTESYLYELYTRAPKFDELGVFGWKDLVAAARRDMSLKDYVIGGIYPQSRKAFARLAQILELYGFEPAINTGFRGDYRQRLVSDHTKAAVGYSHHGGSYWGGWGHGTAMDLVSAKATSPVQEEREKASRPMWDWIALYGRRLGVGQPLRREPWHVEPLASPELAVAGHHGRHLLATRRHHRHRHLRLAHR